MANQAVHEEMSIRGCTDPIHAPDWYVDDHIKNVLRNVQSVSTVIECACLADGTYFARGDPNVREARAFSSLCCPIEEASYLLEAITTLVFNWGARARYFEAVTKYKIGQLPSVKLRDKYQARTTARLRSLLYNNGDLDPKYIKSFGAWRDKLEQPLIALEGLVHLVTSLLDTGSRRPCSVTRQMVVAVMSEDQSDDIGSDGSYSTGSSNESASTDANVTDVHGHGQGHMSSDITKDLTALRRHGSNATVSQAVLSIAQECAQKTPYWRTRFMERGHHDEDLSISSTDLDIYSHALRYALTAFNQAAQVTQLCEMTKREAERAAMWCEAQWDAISMVEERLECKQAEQLDGKFLAEAGSMISDMISGSKA